MTPDPAALPVETPGTTIRYHIDEHLRPILRAVLTHPAVTVVRRPIPKKDTTVKIAKTTLTLTLAAAMALGMSACSFEEPTISEAPAVEQTEPTDEPAPAPEPEPEEMTGVGTFGEVASWDGVDVTISEPEPFEPSEWAAGAEMYPNSISVEVTLTNTGNRPLDPSMSYITASSGGAEASEIYDDNVGGSPMTSILAGKSVTYTVAFNVSDPADVVVEFTPDFEYESVLFTTGGDN